MLPLGSMIPPSVRPLLWFCLAGLWLVSCATSPVLRSLKDVRDAYRPGDIAYVESLMDATTQPNRDVQAASLDRLSRYYENLSRMNPASWTLSPAQVESVTEKDSRARRERILVLKKKALESKKEEIRRHFERVFSLSTDFNVRNLCLQARSECGDEGVTPFLAKAVGDSDPACAEWALRLLRPRLGGAEFSKTIPVAKVPGLEATLDLFSKADGSIFLASLNNLLAYPARPEITQALTTYAGLCQDPTRKILVEQALKTLKGGT